MKKTNIFLAVLAALAWSTAGLFVTKLTEYGFDSAMIASGRCIFGALSALLFVLVTNRKALKITFAQLGISVLGGIIFFAMATAYFHSINSSSASVAVVLLYTEPAWVMLISALFWGEKFTRKKIIALPLLIIGCGLVSGIVGENQISIPGILYGLLSAIFYTLYSVCSKLSDELRLNPITFTVYSFLAAAISSMIVSSPIEMMHRIEVSPWYVVLLLAGLGILTGSVASFTYTLAMRKLPASLVASVATIEPLMSAVFSVIFLHERLTVSLAIGVVLILGSILLISNSK